MKSGRTFEVRPLSHVPISNLFGRDQSIQIIRGVPGPQLSSPRRRTVVKAAAATAVLAGPLAAALPARAATDAPAFLHGVASGDPLPDGILLWTRVTPTSAAIPGSGLGPDTEVSWTVAKDKAFTTIVSKGSSPRRPPPTTP